MTQRSRLVKGLLEKLGSLKAAVAELEAIALAAENRYNCALLQTKNGMRVDIDERELRSDRAKYTEIVRAKLYPSATALAREIATVESAIVDLSNLQD